MRGGSSQQEVFKEQRQAKEDFKKEYFIIFFELLELLPWQGFKILDQSTQKAVDALWDKGIINSDTIEEWGEEHMRTPYNYETNRP